MADEIKQDPDQSISLSQPAPAELPKPYDEFEVGEHKVPWFLWVSFILIVAWASVAWIQFFGY